MTLNIYIFNPFEWQGSVVGTSILARNEAEAREVFKSVMPGTDIVHILDRGQYWPEK